MSKLPKFKYICGFHELKDFTVFKKETIQFVLCINKVYIPVQSAISGTQVPSEEHVTAAEVNSCENQ